MIFTVKRHRRQPPPLTPQRPYDVSRGQNRYVTLPYSLEGKQYNSDKQCCKRNKAIRSAVPKKILFYFQNIHLRTMAIYSRFQFGFKKSNVGL